MKRFEGKTVIVTGAASGIGQAAVQRFAEEGASVLATDLRQPKFGNSPAAENILCAVMDVTDKASAHRVIEQAAARWGRLDAVVNAAGIMSVDDVDSIEDEVWDRLLAVNLTGAMHVSRAAVQCMRPRARGAIVNVASVAAFNASAGMASYASAKAGVVAMTRALANRYGREGIRANCVAPGWVRTAMSEAEMVEAAAASGRSVEEEFQQLTHRIALGRIATPAEIAACIAFLASDDASFVTGAVLVADGGARTAATARAL